MKLNLSKHLFILSFILLFPLTVLSDVDVKIDFDEVGLSEFHLAISKHYDVDKKEIEVIRKKDIPDDELPVIFYIAQHLSVKSSRIVKLRSDGLTWHEICKFYAISPELFYVELENSPGPPFGRAYRKYHKRPQRNWREIYLTDSDVINWTNLKLMIEYYSCAPDKVIEMRSNGRGYSEIHNAVKMNRKASKKQANIDKNSLKRDNKKPKKK